MVLAAALAMVAVMVIGTLAGSVGLGTVGSLVVPLPAAAVAHHLVERHHRRAFRPTGALPPATLRP